MPWTWRLSFVLIHQVSNHHQVLLFPLMFVEGGTPTTFLFFHSSKTSPALHFSTCLSISWERRMILQTNKAQPTSQKRFFSETRVKFIQNTARKKKIKKNKRRFPRTGLVGPDRTHPKILQLLNYCN